jgi:hypothetical protein
MAKTIPATAKFKEPEFELIENWRRAQPRIPALSEAMRTLIRRGLEAEAEEQRSSSGKGKAA